MGTLASSHDYWPSQLAETKIDGEPPLLEIERFPQFATEGGLLEP